MKPSNHAVRGIPLGRGVSNRLRLKSVNATVQYGYGGMQQSASGPRHA
jgi:hypothetical protein